MAEKANLDFFIIFPVEEMLIVFCIRLVIFE